MTFIQEFLLEQEDFLGLGLINPLSAMDDENLGIAEKGHIFEKKFCMVLYWGYYNKQLSNVKPRIVAGSGSQLYHNIFSFSRY